MKSLMILTVGACLLFAVMPVLADQAADEAAIREATKQAIETINKGDVKAHVALYTDPFEVFGSTNSLATHAKNHTNWIESDKDLQRHTKMLDEVAIVFLAPDIAIHQYRAEFTGGRDDDDKPIATEKTFVARVYARKDGKWMTRAYFATPIEP